MNAIRLRPRSTLVLTVASAAGVISLGWPLLASRIGSAGHAGDAPWLFAALLVLLVAGVLAELAESGMDAKAVAVLGVLAGVGAALRPVTGGATGFSLVFFLLVPAGRVFGRGFGFVLGALTLAVSALLTAGVGPWLPYQMFAAGWIGLGAGCLPRAGGRREVALLAGYAAVTGLLYGLVLNLSFWPFAAGYPAQIAPVPGAAVTTNLVHWLRFDLATSMGFDLPRAAGNAVAVLIAGRPVLLALRRVARRAAFGAAPEFSGGTLPRTAAAPLPR